MGRPRKDRLVAFNPKISYFKPRGIPMVDLSEVCITVDEREAIRLADLLDLSHAEAGKCMGVSRATFGRIIQRARNAVADALINGKAINVEGGSYRIVDKIRLFHCINCNFEWEEPFGSGRPKHCPSCKKNELYRLGKNRRQNK